jgi:hypothetical protein
MSSSPSEREENTASIENDIYVCWWLLCIYLLYRLGFLSQTTRDREDVYLVKQKEEEGISLLKRQY